MYLLYFITSLCLVLANEDKLSKCPADDTTDDNKVGERVETADKEENKMIDNNEIVLKIGECEIITTKLDTENSIPDHEIQALYDKLMNLINDLRELVRDEDSARVFLKTKGIRIIGSNLKIINKPLTKQLLLLLETLFKTSPTRTKSVIPITIVDKLLDIFENDNNLALKAHALDILNLWLPKAPRVQSRVMKIKGLEPFYHQVSKLDASVIQTLLDLLNTIFVEHLEVRKEGKHRVDEEQLNTYTKIGLIERMSSPMMCNGLMKIFENVWSFSSVNEKAMVPVFKLLINIKPYCLNSLRGPNKANLFDNFLNFIQQPTLKTIFEDENLNITEIVLILNDYKNVPNIFSDKVEL